MLGQLLRFGLVGILATVVHMVIGFLLIQAGWHPLLANTCAFVIAFFVSFVGHLGYSFADQETSFSRSFSRFVVVGLIGFFVNQLILAVLIALAVTSDTVSLLISTGCAAMVTFGLSKFWAFRSERDGTSVSPNADAPKTIPAAGNLPDQTGTN